MSIRLPSAAFLLSLTLPVALLALVALVSTPREARAAIPQSVLALAGPLAEQFGVPASAVTGLLEKGISLESVTQLLLVTQSSGKSLDQVTNLFRKQGNDVAKAANELGVAADKYSATKVDAAIDRAKTQVANAATDKAADSAAKAAGSWLGGKN